MTRLIAILCVACAVGIGIAAWSQLSADETTVEIPKDVVPGNTAEDRSLAQPANTDDKAANADQLLHAARTECSLAALNTVVEQLVGQTLETKEPNHWHVLAEAYLERALQRTHLLGMTPGQPTFSALPDDFANDLEAGLAAVHRARELGDESGELYRIEAGLMAQHITGLGTALQWNGKINQALKSARERRSDDPQLHVALGLRKLLAPTWFGHDPKKALEHFEFACKATDDERPAVFASMASHLQKEHEQAVNWLEQAVNKNPANKFARVVLKRLRRGEDYPFGRNVSEAEVSAAK